MPKINFYEHITEGIIVIDDKGNLVYLNKSAAEIFSLDKNVHEGKNFIGIISESGLNDGFVDDMLETIYSGKAVKRNIIFNNKDKKYFLCMCSSFVNEEEFRGIIVIFSDISALDGLKEKKRQLELQQEKSLELRDKNELLESILNTCIDDNVANELLDRHDTIKPYTDQRNMTVVMLMSPQLRSMVSQMPPEDYMTIVNKYFSLVIPIIKKYGGTIMRMREDGIFMGFGAPLDDRRHTDNAVLAACRIQAEAIPTMNRWNEEHSYPSLGVQIGMSSTVTTVGAIGNGTVRQYSAFGQNVCFAARIAISVENHAVAVAEETLKSLSISYKLCGQYEIVPKGFTKPVTIYKVGLQ